MSKLHIPQGYRFAGVNCGLKSDPDLLDLSLVVSDFPATGVGVYTQNRICGAAVNVSRNRTPNVKFRAIVANSKIANDCTGPQGFKDALEMTHMTAHSIGVEPEQTLVMSTGVIGVLLPMDKIHAGIIEAAGQLASDEESFVRAAKGIMTTDTFEKTASRQITLEDGRTITIAGFCKGAAMISPIMRTMLAAVLTDAAIMPMMAEQLLREAVNESFNCISVDGHTSPSDTVLFLANGAACPDTDRLPPSAVPVFAEALRELCIELAVKIPSDGEGASHLITIDVQGCRTREDAQKIARRIAEDVLVKTAICGADPNWGRIISAVGNAGLRWFNVTKVSLQLNGFDLYRNGVPVPFDKQEVSDSIKNNRDTYILVTLDEGESAARFWSTDLTAEYVRLNSEYTT